jgi:hypothetical protein
MIEARWKFALLGLVSLSLSKMSHAETYACTDSTGRTIFDVRPPPECKDRDIRILNPDGSVKRNIPAPLTLEQQRERDGEGRKRAQEEFEQRLERNRHSLDLPLQPYGIEEIQMQNADAIQFWLRGVAANGCGQPVCATGVFHRRAAHSGNGCRE